MQEEVETHIWLKRILTGLPLLAANLLVGALLGLLWVKFFVPAKAMGWDGIADAIGGMMVGGLAGLVATLLMATKLSLRVQWIWIGIVAVAVGLMAAANALTAPEPEAAPPQPILAKSFQPVYRVGLRVTHTQEILADVAPDQRAFSFVETEVSTGLPQLIRVGWGPDFARSVAEPSADDLEALLPQIREAMAVAGPYCRTPEDDLGLSFTWRLAGESGNQRMEAGCFADDPAFTALAAAVGGLADRLCGVEADNSGGT